MISLFAHLPRGRLPGHWASCRGFSKTEGLKGMKSGPGSNALALLKTKSRLRLLDLGEKDCRSSRSEISDVSGRGFSLRRVQGLAQPLRAFEPQLRNAVGLWLAAVYGTPLPGSKRRTFGIFPAKGECSFA